jgi:hypothetical protein
VNPADLLEAPADAARLDERLSRGPGPLARRQQLAGLKRRRRQLPRSFRAARGRQVADLGADQLADRHAGDRATGLKIQLRTHTPVTLLSEVQLAAFGEVFSDAGDMTADNSIFRRVAYDAALTTSHDVTITVTPGQSDRAVSAWKAVARSFTPDGRSATSAPLVFSC